ncbi:MAG TPA: ATP-grasp domain-containing protein, partial [Vicinamibacteria bacterium]|nr:ATP-grasp domain-containing protein [Vicinamibacteria bacterium]
LTVLLAREAGFPCPATRLYDGPGGLASAAEDLGFPMVVKPRFTSGGRGMAIVRDRRELAERAPAVAAEHGPPLLQEYIPGGDRGSVQLVLGRDGKVLFAFHKARRRKLRLTARYGTVSESAAPDGPAGRTAGLVARLGWWGAIGVETIHDPRDGVDKLMEINPRFPRQLWNRTALGINEPWMCLRLARGEEVAAVEGYPLGVLFVSPVEDAMLLAFQVLDRAAYRLRCAAGRPLDPASAAPPVVELLRSFAATYRGRRRRLIDPYSRFFLQDPATSLSWWLQFSTWVFGGWRHLGR